MLSERRRQHLRRWPRAGRGTRPLLCGRSVVVLQQSTQPCTTADRSVTPNCRGGGEEQEVPHALMVPFVMVMRHELANRVTQRAFAHEDQSVQTRFLDRPYEAFCVRVETWRASGQANCLDARRCQRLTKRVGEHRGGFLRLVRLHQHDARTARSASTVWTAEVSRGECRASGSAAATREAEEILR